MTALEWWRLVRRNLLVVAVGLGLTLLAAYGSIPRQVVYWSDTTLRLISVENDARGVDRNGLVASTGDLVALAGVIVEEYPQPARPKVNAMSRTLLDIGDYDGVWVRLPDAGGQWDHLFGDAAINVQVSGSEPEQVRARMRDVVDRLSALTTARSTGPDGRAAVVLRAAPPDPLVAASSGSRTKTLALVLALGVVGTVALVHVTDRMRRGGRHRAPA